MNPTFRPKRNLKPMIAVVVHLVRVSLFVIILLAIRFANQKTDFQNTNLSDLPEVLALAQQVIPGSNQIGPFDATKGINVVENAVGQPVGSLLQTSPGSDDIIGYSGPTNCLIILDDENRIRSIRVRESGDTVDHVAQVKSDPEFLAGFEGLGFDESTETWASLDGVSGATLTSYAIVASVAKRMSGSSLSLKFDPEPQMENVRQWLSAAARLEASNSSRSTWRVLDKAGDDVGHVLTTTPAGDPLSGYQGPTNTLVVFDIKGKCLGLVVDQSYENEPYSTYLNDDYSFQGLYQGKSLEELVEMDPDRLGIEGVSGATMTSMTVAKAIPLAADLALSPVIQATSPKTRTIFSYWTDVTTILITLVGVAFSFTKLAKHRWFRVVFQILTIVLLGLTSGHLLSQAMIAGWAKHGIPWQVVPGLVALTFAAFLVPITSKHQPYCQHICPFGAIQQLTRNRLPWNVRLSRTVARSLEAIPWGLLAIVIYVAISRSSFNLAALEPFDAFAFRVAGWATIGVFVFGLGFSLLSPMAYCRFGCPTGALLNFLKFRGDSHRLGMRDLAAGSLTLLALGILMGWFG